MSGGLDIVRKHKQIKINKGKVFKKSSSPIFCYFLFFLGLLVQGVTSTRQLRVKQNNLRMESDKKR